MIKPVTLSLLLLVSVCDASASEFVVREDRHKLNIRTDVNNFEDVLE